MSIGTPAAAPTAARPIRLAPFVVPGVVLAVLYSMFATWTVGQGFGGYDADGGWVDFDGAPTAVAPETVDAVGHPALWVHLTLIGILVAAAVWAARAEGPRARRREAIGVAVAAAFIVAVLLVFTVLQAHLVQEAFARGDPRPVLLGNASLRVGRMPPG